MKPDIRHKRCGIYCIRNMVNNKTYIGKSKNIYSRIHQHIKNLTINSKDENDHLKNAWSKYGEFCFEYFVLEYLEPDEEIVAERELYWMKIYNSLETGYNLRSDSNSRMIVHETTTKKISERLKKEWAEGKRKDHSRKLTDSWANDLERKHNQCVLFSRLKTKYLYKIDNNLYTYTQLKEEGFKNAIAEFFRKKSNIITFKSVLIERVKIEDIVQSSEKSEKN